MPKTSVRGTQVLDGSVQRVDLDVATAGQAVIRKVIAGTNVTLGSTGADVGTGDVTINVSSSSGPPVFTTVEVSIGTLSSGWRSGSFLINSSGLTAGKPVMIRQASGPYTGKGIRADESEMDAIRVVGRVLNATTIQCYWESTHRVRGNYKFDYMVSG